MEKQVALNPNRSIGENRNVYSKHGKTNLKAPEGR